MMLLDCWYTTSTIQ